MRDLFFLCRMFQLIQVMKKIINIQNDAIAEIVNVLESQPLNQITKDYLQEVKKHLHSITGNEKIEAEFENIYEKIEDDLNEKEI